ncbi:hypothetical protein [Pseudobacteriovorax antillogorgiicola]|uniref:Uncharacterized protein n=1 Tax=Pseudobacteriovorax antillogorgiicola TaxID=1513793 RepID=A0A1Y6CE98_9BACT|nr:hypothetical protein [Pseudobacteriovorax antillogorgiicola]TCS47975.1 hypothetical protein EDD56_11986 [Pseudobacteriovorax antillogorgiicola]SMF58245.1 hypothetical protein SAMN06296036_11987 [Pseudobacteriovorax antillogorgiicola]
MKRLLILFLMVFSQSDVLLASTVLKVKDRSTVLVALTRAEADQISIGDKVTVFKIGAEKEAIEAKVIRLKEGHKALITSEDFVEFKVTDSLDVAPIIEDEIDDEDDDGDFDEELDEDESDDDE